MCGATTRGIKKVPHAVPFPTARRPVAQASGSAATVPFHYNPPPLIARDPTTMSKNAPKVPFAVSTRESWNRANVSQPSLPNAGPGAYDVVRGMAALSTAHKTVCDGSFYTARRDAGSGSRREQTPAGPGTYAVEGAVDYLKPKAGKIPFPTAKRWPKASNEDYPAPRAYKFLERHTPHMAFSTAKGHTMEAADPVTAAIPIRDCERLPKHKPAFSFGTGKRW